MATTKENKTVLCTGTYERAMDGKNRILLPKAVRKTIADGATLFITPGMAEDCLEMHPVESLEPLVDKVSQMNVRNKDRQSFLRLLFSRTEKCELDGQFRIRIPARLAATSLASSNTVIVGVGSYWEIWDPDKWQKYNEQHEVEFEAMAEIVLGAVDSAAVESSAIDSAVVKAVKPR